MSSIVEKIYDEPLMSRKRIGYNSMFFEIDQDHRGVIWENIIVVCEMGDTTYISTGGYHTVGIARAIDWYLKNYGNGLCFSSYGVGDIDWGIHYIKKREDGFSINGVEITTEGDIARLGGQDRGDMVIETVFDGGDVIHTISYQK